MNMTLSDVLGLIGQGVRDPRGTADVLIRTLAPDRPPWSALAAVTVLSVLLTEIAAMMVSGAGTQDVAPISPLLMAALVTVLLSAFAFGAWKVGQAIGGRGTLAQTVLLTAFVQLILLAAQVIQVALLFVAPPLSGIFLIVAALAGFWINVNVIDVLHGFGSLLKSFALVLLVTVGLALLLWLVLGLAGLTPGLAPMEA